MFRFDETETVGGASLQSLGQHHLMELYSCDASLIDDQEVVRRLMVEGARRSGATVVGEHFHKFAPQGVSGVVILAESHFAVHTWPEHGFVAVDLFGCGNRLDIPACFDFMEREFGAAHSKRVSVRRGEHDEISRHLPAPATNRKTAP
jgi:S-adenosylmethionine decarboxylase proenzyme